MPSRWCSPAFWSLPAWAPARLIGSRALPARLTGSRALPARLIGSRALPGAGRPSLLPWPGIVAVGGVYVGLLPWVFEAAQGWSTAARLAVALALLGPIGFFLGMPFPLGLKALGARAPSLVPWAWGINACASVVSASLATFIALHIGFTPVLGCALVLYALAAAFPPQAAGDAPR